MAEDGSSQLVSDISVLMLEDVMHRLHCLDYESDFCLPRDIQPYHRLFFASAAQSAGNTAQHFHHFMSLCGWLLSLCKRPFAMEKMEDPSSILTRLASELKLLGYDGFSSAYDASGSAVPLNPLKLRVGYGEAVVRVLLFLSERAMDARGWKWGRPRLAADGEVDDEAAEVDEDETAVGDEDDDEITANNTVNADANADNMLAYAMGQAEDGEEIVNTASRPGSNKVASRGSSRVASARVSRSRGESKVDDSAPKVLQFLESTVDPVAWKNEVERVAPRLKAPTAGGSTTFGGAGREWRSHLEQTHVAEGSISKVLPDTHNSLERLAGELADLLSTVGNRERYINTSFKNLASDYSSVNDTYTDLKNAYQSSSTKVSNLTNELATVNEALEDLQQSMTEKGSSMTDTSPLLRIKTALSAIRTEVKLMDLHLGVVGHAVMQSKVDHKTSSSRAGTGEDSEED